MVGAWYLLKHKMTTYNYFVNMETMIAYTDTASWNLLTTEEQNWIYEAIAKTHEPEDLRDEDEEPLLYNEKDPFYAVLLDDLPGSTAFDPTGKLIPASMWETVKVHFFPGLTIVGHGIYILFSIFR